MNEPYPIQTGIPLPETRGRKKGSVDRHHAARQEAVARGVTLVATGLSYMEAARLVRPIYDGASEKRMARLISQSIKDNLRK